MARTNNLTNFLTDVSSAIKQKTGDNTPIPASDFDTEILSIETAGNYQSKTLNVTQNGNYNLLPDQDYDAISNVDISVNVPTGEDLETEISAQEEYIAQLEAIIDTKAAGSGDGSSMNVFVQETEPEVKKGLWLQTDKEMEHIYEDTPVTNFVEWYPDDTCSDTPITVSHGAAGIYNGNIYLLRGSSIYAYNIETDTYTLVKTISNFKVGSGAYVAKDNCIYIFGTDTDGSYMSYLAKYNMETNIFTTSSGYGSQFYQSAVLVDDYIYVFGGWYNSSYKFNITTNVKTNLASMPANTNWPIIANVGNKIYLFGGKPNSSSSYLRTVYVYNINNNTFTNLGEILPFDAYKGVAITKGDTIYIFNNTEIYAFDTNTNLFSKIDDIPHAIAASMLVINGNQLFLFGSSETSKGNIVQNALVDVVTSSYADNSTIISKSSSTKIGHAVELFSNNLMVEPLLYTFADAWFYTTEDGLITDIPSYYGDGTQWINFKNPPVEEVEE